MKAHLMFIDKDFHSEAEAYYDRDNLLSDLELKEILSVMADDDKTIAASCLQALLSPLQSAREIQYRQEVLKDAIRNPKTVRKLYDICVGTEKKRCDSWYWLSSKYLASTFSSAVELLNLYMSMLAELRHTADESIDAFQSVGFRTFFAMLQSELSDAYFEEVKHMISELKKTDTALISSGFGSYLQGVGYVLRRRNDRGFLRRWWLAPSYTIADRDEAGAKDLGKRRDRAINEAANALAQAAEHLESFFSMLRSELAFYTGCLNLYDALALLKTPVCIPSIREEESKDRTWTELYDCSLALMSQKAPIGNDYEGHDKELYIITGANQGGKTTFLRSLGQAQMMSQCGMFACASMFAVPIRRCLYTHFKKEEDHALNSGKLDEELVRMSGIADHLSAGCMILFNESFASTNEREGSEISNQITRALIENGIEVFSVTHLYTFAEEYLHTQHTQFLRAQRLEDGERTFRLVQGEPLETAFGEDLYRKIFLKKIE